MEAKNFKALMQSKGIKQKFVADNLGVSTAIISKWANGQSSIPEDRVLMIKKLLK